MARTYVCQGCGKDLTGFETHSYQDCVEWINKHPEDIAKITIKRLYYGAKEATPD